MRLPVSRAAPRRITHLRTLDKAGCEQILVQEVPGDDKWDAIRDRLLRGAAASEVENAEFASTGALGVLP